jgi:DNA-binding NarL/FixJ family response regulator
MPRMDGLEAIRRIRRQAPGVHILVLTTFDTDSDVLPAIEAGAIGYLLKDVPVADLLRAVRSAAQGESVLAPAAAARLMSRVRAPVHDTISQRELQVLRLIAEGMTNREAAAKLFISEASVKTHLAHIYDKLGVHDRASAVGEGFRRGLVT